MSIILELILAFEINNRLSNLTIEPVLVSNRPDCYLFKNVFDTIYLIQFPRYISDTYCIEDFKSVNSVLDIPQHAILSSTARNYTLETTFHPKLLMNYFRI